MLDSQTDIKGKGRRILASCSLLPLLLVSLVWANSSWVMINWWARGIGRKWGGTKLKETMELTDHRRRKTVRKEETEKGF